MDDLLANILLVIQRLCPHALSGLPFMSKMAWVFVAIVPRTCVTTVAITRNYQSSAHTDNDDLCGNGVMSAMAWFAKGMVCSILPRDLNLLHNTS